MTVIVLALYSMLSARTREIDEARASAAMAPRLEAMHEQLRDVPLPGLAMTGAASFLGHVEPLLAASVAFPQDGEPVLAPAHPAVSVLNLP